MTDNAQTVITKETEAFDYSPAELIMLRMDDAINSMHHSINVIYEVVGWPSETSGGPETVSDSSAIGRILDRTEKLERAASALRIAANKMQSTFGTNVNFG